MKIKKVLISQPPPENDKSPYSELVSQFNLELTFRKFIKIESIGAKEFRKKRIQVPEYTAIIFTSKQAIDHFFGLCEELRVQIADTTKYFCTSEAIALYLQKYVQYRKRKIFFGKYQVDELLELIRKHKDEKYLFPCAENHHKEIPQWMRKHKIHFAAAPIYRTVSEDLSDIPIGDYQMLVFFSPFGIRSLRENFPDFRQGDTLIAAFGEATAKAVQKEKLTLNIKAPTANAPSMSMAIQEFLEARGNK